MFLHILYYSNYGGFRCWCPSLWQILDHLVFSATALWPCKHITLSSTKTQTRLATPAHISLYRPIYVSTV